METEAKYIKKIRDALKKKTGGVSKIFSGPNTKAKYLNDIAKTIDGMDIGGKELEKNKVLLIHTYTAPDDSEKASVTFTEMNTKFADGYAILLQRPTNKGGLAKLENIVYDTPGKILAIFSSVGNLVTQNGISQLSFWKTVVEFTMDGESNTVSTVEAKRYLFTRCVEKSVTLVAGQTTASFVVSTTEISDLSSSSIDIYTSIWGAEPSDVRISGTTLNIDFDAQQTDMTVKVRIS